MNISDIQLRLARPFLSVKLEHRWDYSLEAVPQRTGLMDRNRLPSEIITSLAEEKIIEDAKRLGHGPLHTFVTKWRTEPLIDGESWVYDGIDPVLTELFHGSAHQQTVQSYINT